MEKKQIAYYVLGAAAFLSIGYGSYIGYSRWSAAETIQNERLTATEAKASDIETQMNTQIQSLTLKLDQTKIDVAEHNQEINLLFEQYADLSAQQEDFAHVQGDMGKQLMELNKEGKESNRLTDVRITELEKKLDVADKSLDVVFSVQNSFKTRINSLENNLVLINKLMRNMQVSESGSYEGKRVICGIQYRFENEIEYLSFDMPKTKEDDIGVLQKLLTECSEGMELSKKCYDKVGKNNVVRTELVYKGKSDLGKNIVFIDYNKKTTGLHVFMKLNGNDELPVLAFFSEKSSIPVTKSEQQKLDDLKKRLF